MPSPDSSNDEQAIRDLVAEWLRATRVGDIDTVLRLMAEDVVFLTPGNPPMRGREAFAAGLKGLQGTTIEGVADIQEIQIHGDFAWCWNHLTVTMTPSNGSRAKKRAGNVLSVLRREPAGNWVIVRDANMLTLVS